MFKRLNSIPFVKNVLVLVGGTVAAQALVIAVLPIISRLYDPSSFAVLASFSALLALGASIACLRFNIAIPLPEEDSDAADLLVLSLASTTVISLIVTILIALDQTWSLGMLGGRMPTGYIWIVPVALWLAGAYLAFQSWATRMKAFKRIAHTKISRAFWSVVTQLGFGLQNPIPLGLVLGHTMLHGFGAFNLGRLAWREDKAELSGVSRRSMIDAAKKYWRYPTISAPEALINNAGIQVPILIIAAQAAPAEAGFLFLAMRVMGIPLMMIGRSVTQVYLSEAGEKLRDGTLSAFTYRTMMSLAVIGGVPLAALGLIAPFASEIVFGAGWERTGVLIAWMVPWYIFSFVSSPISIVLHITSNQLLALVLQCVGFGIRVGAVCAALWVRPEWISEVYTISGCVFYIFYLLTVLLVLSRLPQNQKQGEQE